ncbi:MAG: zinc-dependent alcohol dehydrogenase [Armatimonadota bacterium]
MKRLIAEAPDRVVVADAPVPEVGANQIMVRAVRSLISPGSELNRVRRLPGDPDSKWPNHDLGYAMAGEIVEVGAEVSGWQIGERVVTMQHHQQFVVTPADSDPIRQPLRIPDEMSWDDAPFLCWGRSCWNWTQKANVQPGETVAVVGLGLVGLLMVMWSKLREPGRIIGLDLDQSRLDLAARIGCDELVNPSDGDAVEAVKALTGGKLADCTLHCAAGPHVEAFELSQQVTRQQGRVVLIGIHSRPLTILPHQFLWKDLLGGCTDYDVSDKPRAEATELLKNGKLPVSRIVTHNVPYTQAPEIYDMLNFRSHEAGAVLLRWAEG